LSSGQHHAGMTKGIASGIGLGAILSYALTPIELSFVAIGCLIGLFMGPDDDHDAASTNEEYVRMVFGKYGLFIRNIIWTPYKIGIKHRSFWSHTPIIGTSVRLLYMNIPLIIFLIKDQDSTSLLELIPRTFLAQLLALPFVLIEVTIIYLLYMHSQIDLLVVGMSLFVGLSVADTGHWILDM
jgi:uncharacterized metal-binding protein